MSHSLHCNWFHQILYILILTAELVYLLLTNVSWENQQQVRCFHTCTLRCGGGYTQLVYDKFQTNVDLYYYYYYYYEANYWGGIKMYAIFWFLTNSITFFYWHKTSYDAVVLHQHFQSHLGYYALKQQPPEPQTPWRWRQQVFPKRTYYLKTSRNQE